jgi:hypothetical protein
MLYLLILEAYRKDTRKKPKRSPVLPEYQQAALRIENKSKRSRIARKYVRLMKYFISSKETAIGATILTSSHHLVTSKT